MIDSQNFLKKAAEKCGAVRLKYKESNLPTSSENIVVFPFFGDTRSSFILSSLILRRIKEEQKSSKYFVLLSWPGHEGLYPYVDEYWQIEEEASLSKLRSGQKGFENDSSLYALILKSLNQYFYDVIDVDFISNYYSRGITKEFFERFKHVKLSLPSIPSGSSLGLENSRIISYNNSRVFLSPYKNGFSFRNGTIKSFSIPLDFWKEVILKLISENFYPIVNQNHFSYDLSSEIKKECTYLNNLDILKTMSAMRLSGCVLDFFCDVSKIALCARTPFICFDERSKYNYLKDYEINDLCGKSILKEYIFGFGAIIESGDKSSWNSNILNHMLVKLNKIKNNIDRESWPSSTESYEIVPYDSVRKIKNKKFGSRFIKLER